MAKIKTFKQWEATDLDLSDFLEPCDQVDEAIFDHMATVVPPQYDSGGVLQAGEAEFEAHGVYFYMAFRHHDGKYFYLGILPEFMQ